MIRISILYCLTVFKQSQATQKIKSQPRKRKLLHKRRFYKSQTRCNLSQMKRAKILTLMIVLVISKSQMKVNCMPTKLIITLMAKYFKNARFSPKKSLWTIKMNRRRQLEWASKFLLFGRLAIKHMSALPRAQLDRSDHRLVSLYQPSPTTTKMILVIARQLAMDLKLIRSVIWRFTLILIEAIEVTLRIDRTRNTIIRWCSLYSRSFILIWKICLRIAEVAVLTLTKTCRSAFKAWYGNSEAIKGRWQVVFHQLWFQAPHRFKAWTRITMSTLAIGQELQKETSKWP